MPLPPMPAMSMRHVVDIMIALMLLGILAAVILYYQQENRKLADYRSVHLSLARLQEQATYHGAIKDVELTETGFPLRLEPHWFGENLPVNVLVSSDRPWVDVAPPGDMADQPPDPVIHDKPDAPRQAAFWYNPNRGIIRARIAPLISKPKTLALYNQINAAALLALPREPDPARTPLAQSPAPVANSPAAPPVSPALLTPPPAAPAPAPSVETEDEAPAYATLLARPPSRDER